MIVFFRAQWQGATRARFSNFPKGSGVTEDSIPIVVAEEADEIPGDVSSLMLPKTLSRMLCVAADTAAVDVDVFIGMHATLQV